MHNAWELAWNLLSIAGTSKFCVWLGSRQAAKEVAAKTGKSLFNPSWFSCLACSKFFWFSSIVWVSLDLNNGIWSACLWRPPLPASPLFLGSGRRNSSCEIDDCWKLLFFSNSFLFALWLPAFEPSSISATAYSSWDLGEVCFSFWPGFCEWPFLSNRA